MAVVVKARLPLVARGTMALGEPDAVLEDDEHHHDSPAFSLRRAREVVPWRRRVDVTLHGQACTAGGEPLPATSVRLAIYRGQHALLDKSLYVYGDRTLGADGTPTAPTPFTKMPLRYERARRSDANPTGVDPTEAVPNLYDPAGVDEAAGFGPISRYAKSRRVLLGEAERKAVEGTIAELPDGFDGSYFQAAPADQQLPELRGDEWIVLDGFDPDHRRIAAQLPAVRAEALVLGVDADGAAAIAADAPLRYRPIALAIDGLHVDAEAGHVSLTWRGSFAVADAASLGSLRVVGGVTSGADRIDWPAPASFLPHAPRPTPSVAEPSAPAPAVLDETAPQTGSGPRAALPWDVAWSEPGQRPVPQRIGTGVVTYADARGATITLSPADRERVAAALPFVGDGTQAISPEDAARGPAAPFAVAGPGSSRKAEAPEGAPFAKTPGRFVPLPTGDETLGLGDDGANTGAAVAGDETVVAASRFFHHPAPPERGAADAPPPDTRPGVPRRTTEAIPIERQTPLHVAYMPWQHRPPRPSLTMIVKGTCALVPSGAAELLEDGELPTGDLAEMEGGSLRYPSDFAYFKPRADVLLVGHAYAPWEDERKRRRAGVATRARLQFGDGEERVDRTLAVFGERRWEKAFLTLAPTEPLPFERMPLVYERAFGGPEWSPNPVGVGHGAEAGPDGIARLPNLEAPHDLIDSPGDKPRPACFAPVHPLWGPRQRSLGTYDTRWLADRWPYFPEDFDWSHFQCAPPEQRLETIGGDEPFILTGVHPEHVHLEGRLPGIRPCLFMAVRGDEAGAPGAELAFERVALRLDTVVLDTDAMKVHLVWRGVVEVSAEHAPEVEALFLMHDGPGEETSVEQAYARFVAAVTPTDVIEDDPDLPTAPANDVVEAADTPADELDRRIDAMVADHDRRAKEAGLAAPVEGPPSLPSLDPESILETLRASGASEEDIASVRDALAPEPEKEPPPPPAGARERAEAILATNRDFRGVELTEGNLSELDFGGCAMAGCDLRQSDLRRARLAGADLTGALLDGADLSGADLSGADLDTASLTDIEAEGAIFDEAQMNETDLSGARGPAASFRRARGRRARLTGGQFAAARFDEAALIEVRLDACDLGDARFDGADMTEALLFDADGAGASFRGATLTDALGDGASFVGASFHGARASGSVWEGADLTDASFLEATLDEASFVKAKLDRADLSAAEMRDVRMKRVTARGARFIKSNLLRAQLERSDLHDADFTGASLYACEVWESETGGAVFLDALVAMSKLEGRR